MNDHPDDRPDRDPFDPLGAPAEDDDLEGYLTPTRRFLEHAKGIIAVVAAALLVIPLGWGLVQTFVFNRAGDRVVEQLEAGQLDASLARSVMLVSATTCSGFQGVTGTAFAVVVDGRALLLTNRHVVQDVRSVGLRTLAGGPGPRVASWRLSSSADVAVLELEPGAQMPPTLALAPDGPRPGQRVRTVGFPSGMPFTTAGEVVAVRDDVVVLGMQVDPGASGSPVLDTSGAVVAQVFARTARGRGIGTPVGTLRAALDDVGASRSGCQDAVPDVPT